MDAMESFTFRSPEIGNKEAVRATEVLNEI